MELNNLILGRNTLAKWYKRNRDAGAAAPLPVALPALPAPVAGPDGGVQQADEVAQAKVESTFPS